MSSVEAVVAPNRFVLVFCFMLCTIIEQRGSRAVKILSGFSFVVFQSAIDVVFGVHRHHSHIVCSWMAGHSDHGVALSNLHQRRAKLTYVTRVVFRRVLFVLSSFGVFAVWWFVCCALARKAFHNSCSCVPFACRGCVLEVLAMPTGTT